MPLHAATDSAIRFEDFGSAAGPNRHSYRRARGQIQGTPWRGCDGGFGGGSRASRASEKTPTREIRRGKARLCERADASETDTEILRDFGGGREASGDGGDAAGPFGARTRPDSEGGTDDCRSRFGSGYRVAPSERSHPVPHARPHLLGLSIGRLRIRVRNRLRRL
jgi:hypothetical protein